MGRVLGVVAPHLDDAALSCAQLLAAHPGAHVVTVFAGGPSSMHPLTAWDRASGCFRDGDDVLSVRRREDAGSSRALGATSHHLDFWDSQYREGRYGYEELPAGELDRRIAEALAGLAASLAVDAWLVPLGIGHVDHEAVGAACLGLARTAGGELYAYEELPYRRERPGEVAEALRRLAASGFAPVRDDALASRGSRLAKVSAIRCHASQLPALGRRRLLRAVVGPERLWRLSPR